MLNEHITVNLLNMLQKFEKVSNIIFAAPSLLLLGFRENWEVIV